MSSSTEPGEWLLCFLVFCGKKSDGFPHVRHVKLFPIKGLQLVGVGCDGRLVQARSDGVITFAWNFAMSSQFER